MHLKSRGRRCLLEMDRHSLGRWTKELREAQACNDDERSRAVAGRMCRAQGLVVSSATEVVDKASQETMLMRQAALGTTSAVLLLYAAGAQSEATDCKGQTSLMFAVSSGQTHTALTLLQECRAHVNAADSDGLTAVMKAAQGGHKDTVAVLVEKGADVNAAAIGGMTAALLAAQRQCGQQ